VCCAMKRPGGESSSMPDLSCKGLNPRFVLFWKLFLRCNIVMLTTEPSPFRRYLVAEDARKYESWPVPRMRNRVELERPCQLEQEEGGPNCRSGRKIGAQCPMLGNEEGKLSSYIFRRRVTRRGKVKTVTGMALMTQEQKDRRRMRVAVPN